MSSNVPQDGGNVLRSPKPSIHVNKGASRLRKHFGIDDQASYCLGSDSDMKVFWTLTSLWLYIFHANDPIISAFVRHIKNIEKMSKSILSARNKATEESVKINSSLRSALLYRSDSSFQQRRWNLYFEKRSSGRYNSSSQRFQWRSSNLFWFIPSKSWYNWAPKWWQRRRSNFREVGQ